MQGRPLIRWLAGALLLLAGASAAAQPLKPWTGGPPAPLSLRDLDGKVHDLATYRGKVVLVNFWATWCEPCVTEMPSLQRVRERFAPRFEVLGVNYQESPARIQAFIDKSGITFPIVRDTDGAVAKAWGVRIFPASYLVDRAGHVKHVLIGGADWTGPHLVSAIRALL